MGPMGRHPAGGRNWEGFGSDPVLQAIASAETIKGIQSQGIIATAKHFVGNEQEHFRKPNEWGLPEAISSNIDDRTLHEIYAWPFAESIRAGVASVMCSYQMLNNSYACQNSKLMNGILKDEMGFQGFVQSDWLAQRGGVASALAGLDVTMPGDGLTKWDGKSLFGSSLTLAVLNESVPIERINDMAARVVAAWYQLGQDAWDSDGPNFSSWTKDKHGKLHEGSTSPQNDHEVVNKFVEAEDQDSVDVARHVAQEGTVLLKNDNNLLPLDYSLSGLGSNTRKVAIIGEDAGPGNGPNYCEDRACNQGTLAVGWGSGATDFNYLVDPLSALNASFDKSVEVMAHLKNKLSSTDRDILKHQDLCIVFANAVSGEGHQHWKKVKADRNDLYLQKDGTTLIKDTAFSCGGPTIVVIHSVGPVIVSDFADFPQVKAILWANLPGQESGNALADVIFGKVDASGRLPYTIARSMKDYGPTAPIKYFPDHIIPQTDFTEGLYIDYRYLDKQGIDPSYPFGFGLSYTTFEYSNFQINNLKPKSRLPAPRAESGIEPPTFDSAIPDPSSALFPSTIRKFKKFVYPYIKSVDEVKISPYPYPNGYDTVQPPSQAGGAEGGNPSLFESHVDVSVTVKNTGSRSGKEVVQVYVSLPNATIDQPVRVLRNFTKLSLEPEQEQTVKLELTRKDLSYWDVVEQNWVMPEGDIGVAVGRSSRDMEGSGVY
jgi:beta-glucosidase-like glycosyl hydrolase